MNDNVANSIIKFIAKECEERIKRLRIVWYGGEPLLDLSRIESMMEMIHQICNKGNIKLSTTLVTNGYLLSEAVLLRLKKCGINSMQITLDGPPEVHNIRRKLLSGIGTFEIIYNNIISTLKQGFVVGIRINTDKQNISSLPSLFEILAKNEIVKEHGFPYLGMTTAVSYSCHDFPEDYCFSTEDFAKERYLMQCKLIELGFKSAIKPSPKGNFCLSIGSGAYVVDPFGNLYKCWIDVGIVDRAVGRLDDGEVKHNNVELLKWLSYDPFKKKQCLNCKIVPLCLGGCYYYPVRRRENSCSELKYRLKEYLFLYASQKEAENIKERG